jgi:DNA topoisomerase I
MITAQVSTSNISALQDAAFYVVDKQESIIEESAPQPYSTATLLQDAITLYGWSSSQVMQSAQWLFENGLITYPRTDSTSVAPEAADEARKIIIALYGEDGLDRKKRWNTQSHESGAHEAIRPTSSARYHHQLPAEVNEDCRKLYALIWKRFIAWHMPPATYRVITVEMETDENTGQ